MQSWMQTGLKMGVCVCVGVSAFRVIRVLTCLFSQRRNSPPSSHRYHDDDDRKPDCQLKWCLRFWHSFQVCHRATCLCVLTCCPSHPSLLEETTKTQQGTKLKLHCHIEKIQIPALSNQVQALSIETIHYLWFQGAVYGFNQISTVYDFKQNILNINEPSRQTKLTLLTYDVTARILIPGV